MNIDLNNYKESPVSKPLYKKRDSAVISVFTSFNNTIVCLRDHAGNVVSWSSSGRSGFRGSKKSTPYASQTAVQNVIAFARDRGVMSVSLEICGPGVGRDASLRAIQASGLVLVSVKDKTNVPHNGCRPPKKRRV